MAEYAGLEIRIGGDTTKLTNALKASTKSAAELQSRIRKATQAMQFDPNSLTNVNTRIRLTGDRMQSLQSKIQIARKAMEQLGDTIVKIGGEERSIRDIASDTDNLSLKAKQADERFSGLVDTLAKIYEAWNKKSRSAGADFAKDQLGIDEQTASRLMSTTTTLSDFKRELKEINDARAAGLDSKPIITPDELKRLTEFKQMNFHDMFKRGLDLDDVVADAKNLGIVIEESAISNVRDLQKAFKEAQDEKKAFDDALTYDQGLVDIQRWESEVEGMSQTMRRLDDSMTEVARTPWFQELESEVRRVDAALENVEGDIKRTSEAMKLDPGNIELAKRHFDALQQKAELSEQKVQLLKAELGHFEMSGVAEAAKGHQDLAKWVEESAEKARIAQKDLNDQRASVQNLTDQTERLKQTIANMRGDTTLASYSDEVERWKSSTQRLTGEMEKLAQKEAEVAAEQQKLGEKQGAFDSAKQEADGYKAKLDELKRKYDELQDAFEHPVEGADFVGMFQEIERLESEIREVQSSYDAAKVNVRDFGKELAAQEKASSRAQEAMQRQSDKVDALKKSISDLERTSEVRIFRNPEEEIEKAEASLRDLEGQLDGAIAKENELEAAYDSARSENEMAKTAQAARDVSQEMDEAKAAAQKAADSMKFKSDSILNPSTVKSLGMTLSATVTPAFTALGYKMVDASSTIDSAYRDMRKTVNGTEEQFESLRKSAIDFSRTHVTSADQILAIEAIGGELGVATEDLEAFATAISNIDVATNLDVEGAADALGHLSNILHLTADDYDGFADALVRLGNNGASTETEIANIAERIGSMGSIVGMSGSDILAWSSTIASTGQNAEAAGTAISKTMSFFETAVASAGGTIDTSFESINAAVEEGGDKLTVFANLMGQSADEFAEAWELNPDEVFGELSDTMEGAKNSLQGIADVAHMTADDFVKAWENDPTQVMRDFIKGLNDIEAAGGSADAVLQSFKITSVRQKQAIEGLMQTIGGLDDNLRMSEDAWNGISDKWGEAGDAANEASKKAEGFSGQLQILKNNAQSALAELGEGAAPWLQMFSGWVQNASSLLSSLDVETKKWIVGIGGIATALGPMLSMGSTLAIAKNEFFDWVDASVDGMAMVKAAYATGGQAAVDALKSTMTTMDKVKMVAGQLGMSLVKGLAIGAVLVGVGMIISELMKLQQRYKEHVAATTGLSKALKGVGTTSEATAESLGVAGRSLQELISDSNDYETRLADLTKTIEDSNKQYGTYAGQMDYYAETIGTLGGKADLTKDEAYRLEAALNAVNDACGTTYGLDEYGNIIDTETGKIQENTGVILANIEARKQQALIDYYSDDYAKAVGEWAEAQDKLNEAQDEYNNLVSDEGKQGYIDRAKEVYGNQYDEAKVLAAYEEEVARAQKTVSNYQTEVNKTQGAIDTLDGKIGAASEELAKQQEVLDSAAKAQAEYERRTETVTNDVTGNMNRLSKAVDELGGDNAGFNLIADGLAAVHANADELNGVDMTRLASSFSDVDGSMQQVIAALEEGGVQMWTWNAALEQAPDAAEKMGSLTASAFQSMYEVAGEDLNATMTLIAGLDAVQIGDKTFYIGDNGSIIDSQGKIYDIQTDLAEIPDEVITQYYVDDGDAAQKALDAKEQLQDIADENPTPTIDVDDKATPKNKSLQDDLNKTGNMKPTPTVGLNDLASSGLDYIGRSLTRLDGRRATVTVTTVQQTTQATGGLNSRPVIPKHATGYIATGPTLTNQGWIGEDGIEAVQNWATGGAVVPLTNRKYMLPIADAIADGMASRMGAVSAGNTYVINGLTVAPDSALAKAMDATFDEAQRYARMGKRG